MAALADCEWPQINEENIARNIITVLGIYMYGQFAESLVTTQPRSKLTSNL
jgi:hypothetical protein